MGPKFGGVQESSLEQKSVDESSARPSTSDSAARPAKARYLSQGIPGSVLPAVVAISASAGGFESLRRMLTQLPANPGMAFVVIQHLDPTRPNTLAQQLQESTSLRVMEAANGTPVEPNHLYVIPSGADLRIEGRALRVVPRRRTRGLQLPIDTFFRSLAEYEGPTIGVVLSGSGADGAEGLCAVKAKGGIVMAQEPQSAELRGMPESAIAAGVVDFRANPEGLADELEHLRGHPFVAGRPSGESAIAAWSFREESSLAEVLEQVKGLSGVDFGGYRRTTVLRRIERRMAVRRVQSIGEYSDTLRRDPDEARALAQEMLLHITSFFRDPADFATLKERVFPTLLQRGEDGRAIRIWVPGCSTGEDAYGLVICLLEFMEQAEIASSIKVFATDLSEHAITTARLGVYPAAALAGVSPERLSRFFERSGGKYRISSEVRDQCTFVKHDVYRDPPFAKLDLISCRNLFIYCGAELHERVIPLLSDCLNPQGYLVIGKAGTVLGFHDRLQPVDRANRVFWKSGPSPEPEGTISFPHEPATAPSELAGLPVRRPDAYPQRQADRLLLARYSPPGVIVNERFEVIEFRGRTGVYLEPPPGKPRGNLLVMTHDSLVPHLHDALERAKAESSAVRQEGVEVETGSQTRVVNLEVVPLPMVPDAPERHFLVVFEEPEATPRRAIMTPVPGVPELSGDRPSCPDANAAAKDYLYSLFSEQQVALEELAVEREEMMVTVRDLQDTNDALRMRNEEAERVANEVADVLSAVEIPIILLDPELKVRRFTRTVGKIAGLVPSDIGRSIHDLRLKLRVDDLAGTIRQVIESASPFDREVQGEDGHWYRVQMRPCINSENQLDAVVLSFIDVDGLRCAVRNAERDCAYAHGILDSVSTAVVVLGVDMRVVSANGAFHALFESSPASVHQSVRELDTDLWRQPALLEPLEEALSSGKPFAGLELEAEVGHLGRRVLRLTCHPLPANNGCARISLVIEDVTELRSLETEKSKLVDAEKRARFAAERANHAKDVFLATLSHELRTPLSTILMSAEILKRVAVADRNVQKASTAIERSATMQVKLVDDLLDVARIASGKLVLEEGSVNLAATVQEAVACARPAAEAKRLELSAVIDEDLAPVYGDGTRLQQVVTNLLNNAIKFTPPGGRISVRLKAADGRGEITVTDTGEGIRPELLPHLFERFVQAETSPRRAHGGLGLGLSIVRHLVELHGGEVHAESRGEGQGATFRVTLPLGVRAGSPTSSRVVARGIGGVKVLLVEDDEDSRDAYATMLGQLGADVMAAPSANQGLTAMREFHPQVIIADIVMPGEDGLAFIQRVRQLPPEQGGQTPAAALSAMASQEDRQRSMQLGYQMHVAKPVDSARLAAIVNVLVESRRVATG